MVLAGGRSQRFGSDKLAAPDRGAPLLRRAVTGLAAVCGEVVVVLGPAGPEPPFLDGLLVRFARDDVEGEGPLAGLRAGLEVVRTDLAIAAAGDMPDLSEPVLRLMLRTAEEEPADAVVLQDGERWRPVPCALRTRIVRTEAGAAFEAGERSLRGLLERVGVLVVEEIAWRPLDPAGATLRDVDVPADLDPG